MARRTLSPVGIIAKWLLVPAMLAAVGFFFVGPNIGKTPIPDLAKKLIPDHSSGDGENAPSDSQSSDSDPNESGEPAPEVDVSMQPAGSFSGPAVDVESTRHPKRRTHRTKSRVPKSVTPKAQPKAPAKSEPKEPRDDEGGSGGSVGDEGGSGTGTGGETDDGGSTGVIR